MSAAQAFFLASILPAPTATYFDGEGRLSPSREKQHDGSERRFWEGPEEPQARSTPSSCGFGGGSLCGGGSRSAPSEISIVTSIATGRNSSPSQRPPNQRLRCGWPIQRCRPVWVLEQIDRRKFYGETIGYSSGVPSADTNVTEPVSTSGQNLYPQGRPAAGPQPTRPHATTLTNKNAPPPGVGIILRSTWAPLLRETPGRPSSPGSRAGPPWPRCSSRGDREEGSSLHSR